MSVLEKTISLFNTGYNSLNQQHAVIPTKEGSIKKSTKATIAPSFLKMKAC